jgi:2-amino-4-hydroxy-6-hydroxymethyldihydropteridine diphosphokinase/dihydropteroate synthase
MAGPVLVFAPASDGSHVSATAPSRAFAMLSCTGRLQRPCVWRAVQHVHLTSRRTLSSATATRASWTPTRPCRPAVNIHLATSHRFARLPSRSFQRDNVRFSHSYSPLTNRAYVALGSNMGDRVAMIEQACKMMEASGQVKILQTSSLYETKAMYVLDQDNFVNGACEVSFFHRLMQQTC